MKKIAKIRRANFQNKKIKEICLEFWVSRNTVLKMIRSGVIVLTYERTIQPLPQIGPLTDKLDEMLAANARPVARDESTARRAIALLAPIGVNPHQADIAAG